ncbi:MAG: cob(I)yrinic acid a,c-diamide adenosyltransferase [Deltaproteobacteria bacterium]|nr:cob(I)yrinic acid a,c-diamide adenosyltransferase [Deltaproteobacteria bacterium]
MPRLTKIYTKTGDDGTTGLGTGARVSKNSPRIAAYGDVDELSSQIGMALALRPVDEIGEPLRKIQNDLFHLGSDLCIPDDDKQRLPVPVVEDRHIAALEGWIDHFNDQLPPLENFILPGGSPPAAALHVARTVCRRAERSLLTLAQAESIRPQTIVYLNRLSDLLFVLARFQNKRAGVADPTWDSRA